jgi:trans-aconitate methyltransferase
MPVKDPNLADISKRTLAHYEAEAEPFWQSTRDHDVSQNINALLAAIQAEAPYQILDFGCGPGRDLLAFTQRGHLPVGLGE